MSNTTNKGFLTDVEMSQLIVAILVKRLGGAVEIRQEDLDQIAFLSLVKNYSTKTEVLHLRLMNRVVSGQG